MARIRTIKPEFPHSESMGKVSRDARLAFILLWTIADDYGRLRGNSRMLASLLFPYDDDAPKLMDKCLDQLERENCIARYQADGSSYIQIQKWQDHQRVDKPSQSRIPEFREDSRALASPREDSCQDLDQGPRTKEGIKDQGGGEGGDAASAAPPAPAPGRGTRLSKEWDLPVEWGKWAEEQGMTRDAIIRECDKFKDFWIAKSGKDATKSDWFATWRNWIRRHLVEYAK